MAKEVRMADMDRVMETLESRDKARVEKASVGQAVKLYYPQLAELKERKGYAVRDLYEAFREIFPEMSITLSTFTSYWQRAKAAHGKAGKPAKAEASPGKDGDTAAKSEVARTVQKPVSESPQAMPKKPEAGTKPVAQEPKPVVETPKPAVPQDDKPASQTGHVSQARPTPGFMPEGETRARSELLKKMAMEM